MGFENITAAGGVGLAITGLTIVFAALILVTLFIAALPRMLPLINSILPVVEDHYGASAPSASAAAKTPPDDEVIAAIGFVLHTRRGN